MEERTDRVQARHSSVISQSSTEREALDVLEDLSKLLHTGLSSSDLKAAMVLLQQGYQPATLAKVVRDLRAEGAVVAQHQAAQQQQRQKAP
ncbi:unnamed protein product [Sympodiomycopsis kandeliae]